MKTLLFTLLTLATLNAQASIKCHTPNSSKIFEIKDNKVTFYSEYENQANREIASVVSRTRKNASGITKVLEFENQKHTIYIKNTAQFSDYDDYMIIKSSSGHEVIYPIECQGK